LENYKLWCIITSSASYRLPILRGGTMRIRKLATVCLSALGLTLALFWFLGGGDGLLPIARAGSFTVDVTSDEVDGECLDDCSLRDAIILANTNGEADVVTLSSGVYQLTISGVGEDAGATGDLDVTSVLTITGLGPAQTFIDAGGIDRVFDIQPGAGTVVISGVTLLNGTVAGNGGGVRNADADLVLVNTAVISNVAEGSGLDGHGGGMYVVTGSITLNGGQVAHNAAYRGGGVYVEAGSGVFAQTGLSLIASNVVSDDGGGIYVLQGRVELSGARILSNTAGDTGGGVHADQDGAVLQMSEVEIHGNVAIDGGGVYISDGSATVQESQILSNTVTGWGGGMYVFAGSLTVDGGQVLGNTAVERGGGAFVDSASVTLSAVQILSNTAGGRGGGIYVDQGVAILHVIGGQIRGNSTDHMEPQDGGGGLYIWSGDATLDGTEIISNTTAADGGGVYVYDGGAMVSGGQVLGNTAGDDGGGIYLDAYGATFTQTGVTVIARNTALDAGGGMYILGGSGMLNGGQVLTNTAQGSGGGGVCAAGSVTLKGGQVAGNVTAGWGGGLNGIGSASSVLLYGTRIVGNVAGAGGGVIIDDGSATLSETHIISNTATGSGGGMGVRQGRVRLNGGRILSNTAPVGGGVHVDGSTAVFTQTGDTVIAHNTASGTGPGEGGGGIYVAEGSATLEEGAILGNIAQGDGGGMYVAAGIALVGQEQIADNTAAGDGAGIYNGGGTLVLVNTTASGNVATAGGGGLYNGAGTSALAFTTVASNTGASGGGIEGAGGQVTLQNTLVAHNDPANCGGGLVSNGHNLDSGTSCGFAAAGDVTGVDPLIGPLDADGTHPLLDESPAVDAGICVAGVATDQRGGFRPQGVTCDIGAYEYVFFVQPTAVTIDGPGVVGANVSAGFVATVEPVTATRPITYSWQATDLPPVVHTNRDLSDTITLTWTVAGFKAVTVTASNVKGTGSDSYIVDVRPVPTLVIEKSGPPQAAPSTPITYTLTVINEGGMAADSLIITDVVPSGANFVRALDGGQLVVLGANHVVSWSVPSLGGGASISVHFVITATQTITNADYRVSASGGYGDAGDIPLVTLVGAPGLSLGKTGPFKADVGELVTYTLTVVNNGQVAATNLVISDVVPDEAYFVAALDGGQLVGEDVIRWTAPSLEGGAGMTVRLVVTATRTIINTNYEVSADGGLGVVGEEPIATIIGAGTRHVAPDGVDTSNNCVVSWGPCATPQHAVNIANPGEEIRVAAGNYTGAQMAVDGRTGYTYTQVVFITRNLTLRGGFTRDDWNTSDPVVNPTIIDAQRQGRGVSIVGVPGDGLAVTIDGFTITGGDYTGLHNLSEAYDYGGGVYGSLTALTLRNSIITDNIASREPNGYGGGIYIQSPDVSPGVWIEETVVAGNSAPGSSGDGGGIYITGASQPVTISGGTFLNNAAGYSAGGMRISTVGSVVIAESSFLSNTAQSGNSGGAYVYLSASADLGMDRVRFLGNQAAGEAVLYLAGVGTGPRARLTNALFGGNRLTSTNEDDAVVYVNGSADSLDLSLGHVTAAGNEAATFLYVETAGTDHWTTATLTNTLLASITNGFAVEEGGGSEVSIRHTNTLTDDVTTQHHTVAGTPDFEAIGGLTGDSKLDGTYHLLWGSKAIDAGVDAGLARDVDGDRRPQGPLPDVGADEFIQATPASVTIVGPTAGVVDASYAFTAVVSPITATPPITYTWVPGPDDGQGMKTASYHWESSGDKRVTVTVENILSIVPAIGVHDIVVVAGGYDVYLPLVMRN
jgi:uncharacterized repeat protein (TIGR01451 family)/CSLREA domain-containing protein